MKKQFLRDILFSAFILLVTFLIGTILHTRMETDAAVPSLFVFSVFLISLVTQGYMMGILSALISVLAINFAFTFPYFEFNFTIPENLISAIIMIAVTIVTSTLTTKIKEQEKIKLEAEKEQMRANLLRAISHDLRTPLTAIFGASSTVIDNYNGLTDESKLDMISGIKDDSQWLIRMVENLLSVTKIDSTNVKLIKSPVVLEELVDSVIGKFRSRYSDVIVKISVPEEFIMVSADVILIEQVIVNILENAVQHAVGMTEITLRVRAENGKVVFDISDDGCGIEKGKLKSIFKGDIVSKGESYDSNKQNMGIGLFVCATIIRAHGGNISARNNKDKGATFSFSLEKEDVDE